MLTVDTSMPNSPGLRAHEPSPLVLGSPVPPTAGSTGTDDSLSTAPYSSPIAQPATTTQASWSDRSDGEEVLLERADEADDEVSPLSTESMRDKMEQSVGRAQQADDVVIAGASDSVDRLAMYRERSLFVENFDHEVTAEEIAAFLRPTKPLLPQHHVQLHPTKPKARPFSPIDSSASSSTSNLLSRVMSRESSGGGHTKQSMLRFLPPPQMQRPGAIRSRTSPDDLPTQDSLRNRVQSRFDGDMAARRSSLGIAPGEAPANVLRKARPVTMFAPSLGVAPVTPRKDRSGGVGADGSPSPPKKRPLSGLFRRVSTSKKDRAAAAPIRSSVVVTAPTPPRVSVERQSSRRGRPASGALGPPLPSEHPHILAPPVIPPRSSSSMDETRPAMTAHNEGSPLGRYTSVDSTTGSTSSRSHTSGAGGWRNLWRRRKGSQGVDAADTRRDSLPGLTLSSSSSERVGGRPRASTFDSNSDSSGSRWLQTPTTPTAQIAPQLADVSIITGPSASLPRIEEDGQAVDTSKVAPGAISIATEVKASIDSDVVVIPPTMMEDTVEIAPVEIPGQDPAASPDTSVDDATLGKSSFEDVIVSDVTPTQSLAEMTIRDKTESSLPASHGREDKIEVMIIPSSVTGRPKPKVWGSWPSMGNPRPITLKNTAGGSPTRRKSNAGQWLASGAGEDNAGAELPPSETVEAH